MNIGITVLHNPCHLVLGAVQVFGRNSGFDLRLCLCVHKCVLLIFQLLCCSGFEHKDSMVKEIGWKAEVCKGSLGCIGADATILARH